MGQSLMVCLSVAAILFLGVVTMTTEIDVDESVSIHSTLAQTSPTSGNMTAPMMESTSFHLRAADRLLTEGNTEAALDQINLAEIQTVIIKYGLSGNSNKSNSSNGVYHRRLFIKYEDGGKLYYR